ncbi:uncharacterized protein LOC142235733 [Haematobia irritans]|uniref:uncharacterized protein LOC142235733 n=1 Tax=Haematobia irritans TaxID=7368 RepID=UPI003F4F9D14
MKKILSILILVFLLQCALVKAADEGVQCYVCQSSDIECLSLVSFKSRVKFLQTCKTGCAVLLGPIGEMGKYDPSVSYERGCDDMEKCQEGDYHCCTCSFNGCNINNYCTGISETFESQAVIVKPHVIGIFIIFLHWIFV